MNIKSSIALLALAASATALSAQTSLAVGDLAIIGVNANAPDNIAFVTWVPLANNTVIKFSDNGFLSSGSATGVSNARGGENYTIWQNTTGSTIAAGTVIFIDNDTTNLGTANALNTGSLGLTGISASGDQIFAYQGAENDVTPDYAANTNPTTFSGSILFGINMQGSTGSATWLASGTPTSNTSYLPSELNVANGSISFGASTTQAQYTGVRTGLGSLDAYKSLVNNPSNWTIAASGNVTLDQTGFSAVPEPSTYAALAGAAILGFVAMRRRRA